MQSKRNKLTSSKRNSYLLKRFGITEEQYGYLLQKQEGCCGVCRRHANEFKQRLSVDHDHYSGAIRGLLCNYCNRRIVGRHRTPSGAILLRSAADYLDNTYPGWVVPPKPRKKRKKRK